MVYNNSGIDESSIMWQSDGNFPKKNNFKKANRSTFKSNLVFRQNANIGKMSEQHKNHMKNVEQRMSSILERNPRVSNLGVSRGFERSRVMKKNQSEKFYVQKVVGNDYLRHTIGPGKTKPLDRSEKDKGKVWRKILLWEFLGCNFR